MTITRSYKAKLEPTEEQLVGLKKIAGNNRWLWNELCRLAREKLEQEQKPLPLAKMSFFLSGSKKTYEFLKNTPESSMQKIIWDFNDELTKCFPLGKVPEYRLLRRKKDFVKLEAKDFVIEGNTLTIPFVDGPIKFVPDRDVSTDGKPLYCHIRRFRSDWEISFAFEV